MDKIIRCITSDGAIMAACVDASDIVFYRKEDSPSFTQCHSRTRQTFVCNLNYGRYAQTERCVSQPPCDG